MILYNHTHSILKRPWSADSLNLVTFSATLNKESFVSGRHFSVLFCQDHELWAGLCKLFPLFCFIGTVNVCFGAHAQRHPAESFIRMDAISIQEMLVHVQDKLRAFHVMMTESQTESLSESFTSIRPVPYSWMNDNDPYMEYI